MAWRDRRLEPPAVGGTRGAAGLWGPSRRLGIAGGRQAVGAADAPGRGLPGAHPSPPGPPPHGGVRASSRRRPAVRAGRRDPSRDGRLAGRYRLPSTRDAARLAAPCRRTPFGAHVSAAAGARLVPKDEFAKQAAAYAK